MSMASMLVLGAYTLIRCESKKRNLFLAALVFAFISLLSYYFEITSSTTEEAFLAKRLYYLGTFIAPSLLLLFVINYFDFKLNWKLVTVLLAIPLIIIILMWTTDLHKLYYASHYLIVIGAVRHLGKTSGPLHSLGHAWLFLCLLIIIGVLVYEFVKIDRRSRPRLTLIAIGTFGCIISNIIYLLNPFDLYINYGPLAVTIICIFFGINILKYDMFDIIPKASEMALSSMSDAFLLVDTYNHIINANETAKGMFPSVRKLNKYSPIDMIDNWPGELKEIRETKNSGEVKFTMPGGNHYTASISPIISGKYQILGYIVMIHNITESVLLTQKLEEIAYTDALTGILNRRQFMDLAIAQSGRIKRLKNDGFIIIFDLDHFKNVNDTYGHLIGDKVLRTTVDRVKDIIRPYDLFGRYGGEEFIIFALDLNADDIFKLAERARINISSTPMVFDDLELTISASFGITSVHSARNLDDIIKKADDALYQAKNEGRNKVVINK